MDSLGTLSSGIAHDFNNVLSIIIGYTTVLERAASDPDKVVQAIGPIIKAVERGTSLVKQLLTFARKSEPTFEHISVNKVIEELTAMLRATFPKIIVLNLECEPSIPQVIADHNQLHQALLNLCVNARDAMPHGGEIELGSSVIEGRELRKQFFEASEERYVAVHVTDSGMGMDESTRGRIFEPFFTTKAAGKGTGLGLAVVYGVVKSHRGFIDVQSRPGKGTTITMYLPVRAEAIEYFGPDRDVSEKSVDGNELILVVEDEDLLRNILSFTLQRHGYRVLTAVNGLHGIDLFKAHAEEIALIVSDLGLPMLDGLSAFRRIKAYHQTTKLILTNGYMDPDTHERFKQLQVNHFVQKPYSPSVMLRKIWDTLDEIKRDA